MVTSMDAGVIKAVAHGDVHGCRCNQGCKRMVTSMDAGVIKAVAHGDVHGCRCNQGCSAW